MNSDLNSVILGGFVTENPTFDELNKFAQFKIESFRKYRLKDEPDEDIIEVETSFFNIEAYDKLGETVVSRAVKGMSVRVVGRLKQYKLFDNQDKVVIVAEHVDFH